MKKIVIILLVCLVAVAAFAANNSSIVIGTKTSVNGTSITPGNYKVIYDIKGNTADVKFVQAGKTVATATGQVVELANPTQYDSIVNQANADGTQSVIEIQFANKKTAIRLNGEGSAVGK
ncbi:MAG TPA: hypothetical protein VG897_06840 [Terriglobales bacterium]|nr:hypothetical protein [Terriglobales bacterium]